MLSSVDVVVPSFEYARYLHNCVMSILTQDISNLRVLIIDNASTDNSVEVAQNLAAADRRIEVVAHPKNLGPHASFNEGVDWASADYFLILCADDLLTPGCLARAVSIMDRYPDVHLTYGPKEWLADSCDVPVLGAGHSQPQWHIRSGRELIEQFCKTGRNHVNGPTAVVRTSVQKRAGYYRSELQHTDDLEMWMRFACHGNAAETDAIQGISRMHATNQSASVGDIHRWDLEFEAAFDSFFAREGASLPDAVRLHRIAKKSLADRAYWSAMSHFLRGQPEVGTELLRFAFRLRPSTVAVPPLSYLIRRPAAVRRILSALSGASALVQPRGRSPAIDRMRV